MAFVAPFRGVYYSQSNPDISSLITPPYDVIAQNEYENYWKRSPYNFGHLDLATKTDDDYSHSASLVEQWLAKGILKKSDAPSYFLYEQKFSAYGKKHTRRTLVASVGLCDFSKGIIRPHENTFGKYKADRLQLMRKTGYSMSPIFGMVKDEEGVLNSLYEEWVYSAPLFTAHSDDGTDHTFWKIDAVKGKSIPAFFQDRPIYIVDGHHRYESTLMYAREAGVEGKWEHPGSQATFCIANVFDPGLVVYPTHRVVLKDGNSHPSMAAIEKEFRLTLTTPDSFRDFVTKSCPEPKFGLAWDGKYYFVEPMNWRQKESELGKSVAKLAVTWSDRFFLKNHFGVNDDNRGQRVRYEKDFDNALRATQEAQAVVFQSPPAVTDVTEVADENKFMPQKSTFFIPKLANGFVIRSLAQV